MRKIFTVLLCGIMLCSCGQADNEKIKMDKYNKLNNISVCPVSNHNKMEKTDNEYKPVNFDNPKAVWLSYIDIAPMLKGKSENEFEQSFEQACENIKSIGCNTIYVHVRPFGDALYNSKLFQKSRYLDGCEKIDPLKIMVDVGHKYGLSVHGWINPLRCETEENIENLSTKYRIKKWYDESSDKDIISKVSDDEHLWLNPAYEEVRKFIADGAKEIVEKYNVDGIHLDDYFYPTTDKNFDEQCYADKGAKGDLESWRMDNISKMVKGIYNAVKSVNQNVIVGISPQGNLENNYEYMYADVKKWGSEKGYCDYIVPQIYFGYNNSLKPFEKTVSEWHDVVSSESVQLIIGLGVYKIMQEDEFQNTVGIIAEQINDSAELSDGVALYTYNNLFAPENGFEKRMNDETEAIRNVLSDSQ